MPSGPIIVSAPNYVSEVIKSEHTVEDPELKTLISSSIKKKVLFFHFHLIFCFFDILTKILFLTFRQIRRKRRLLQENLHKVLIKKMIKNNNSIKNDTKEHFIFYNFFF